MVSIDILQTVLYLAVSMLSLGAGGGGAEQCDLLASEESKVGLQFDCPKRVVVFIVFSFFTFIVALILFLAYLFNIYVIKRFEVFIVPVVLLFNIIATAVVSSPRTGLSVFYALLSWAALTLSSAAFVVAIKSSDLPVVSDKQVNDPNPTIVPLTGDGTSAAPAPPVVPAPTPVPAAPFTPPPQGPPELLAPIGATP